MSKTLLAHQTRIPLPARDEFRLDTTSRYLRTMEPAEGPAVHLVSDRELGRFARGHLLGIGGRLNRLPFFMEAAARHILGHELPTVEEDSPARPLSDDVWSLGTTDFAERRNGAFRPVWGVTPESLGGLLLRADQGEISVANYGDTISGYVVTHYLNAVALPAAPN